MCAFTLAFKEEQTNYTQVEAEGTLVFPLLIASAFTS
jgi:deoxyhypusine synthase